MTITEIIGWAGTVGVLASFAMKEIKTLRIVSTISSLVWIVYGISKVDYPIIITNGFIVLIHAFYLSKNYFQSKEYKKHE